ncbi:unnamed protein product, partial [Prunus brigantina]
MAAWIRVSAIQLECFDVWALKRIGNLLGKLLKIDALTTAQNRENSKELENLRGPWMNVPPRRRPKNMSKGMVNQGSGSMNQGSRFDALRKVSEDFGFDNVDFGGMAAQGIVGKSFAYKNGAGFEKKTWTKTRQTNGGSRVMLGDISNKHGKSKASGLFGGKTNVGLSGLSNSSVNAKGKKVVNERRAPVFESVNTHLDSWGKDQSLYQEKGVYIFGHQPPNIANNDDRHGIDCESEGDGDYVASSLHDGQFFDEGMDVSTGKVNDSSGNVVSNAFNNGEGKLIGGEGGGGAKALDVVKSLGFSCFEVVDPIGFSGGLWLLWNDNKVRVEVIGTTDQSIYAAIACPSQNLWLFMAIYAKPCSSKREKLWEYLNFVSECHQLPWILAGDFNDMLSYDDKLRGAPLCRLKGFRRWFDDNGMIALGFSGPKYTWSNKMVYERIDRAVCNAQWRGLFAEAFVKHLPTTKSDHCAIKISLKSSFSSSPSLRPFRFEAMWLKHDHFKEFLNQQ